MLFVYGTLRPGLSNGDVTRQSGLLAQRPATVTGYDLFHLEPEGYPAVVPGRSTVVGEVLADEVATCNVTCAGSGKPAADQSRTEVV